MFLRDALRFLRHRKKPLWSLLAVALPVAALAAPLFVLLVWGFRGFVPLRFMSEWLSVGVEMWHFSLLLYCVVRFFVFLASVVRDWERGVRHAPPVDPERRDLVSGALLLLPSAMTVGLFAHAAGSRFDCDVRVVPLFASPGELGGERKGAAVVAQISDLHMGPFFGLDKLEYYLTRVADLHPHVLALTGDLVNSDNQYFRDGLSLWKDFSSAIPIFACMGNHDYVDGMSDFRRIAESAGIRLLVNNRTRVTVGGRVLDIAGIAYPFTRSQAARHLQFLYGEFEQGGLSVLLAHNPSVFKEIGVYPVDLTLSGHTHGGQVVFNRGGSSGSIIDPFVPYSRGLYREGKRVLYVNSGLGSWFALRLNCPPEITLFQI